MGDNLSASQNRGHEVLAVTIALFVAATVAVVLRFISRAGIVRRISYDDYAMIVAWVSDCSLAMTDESSSDIFLAHRFRFLLLHLLRNHVGFGQTPGKSEGGGSDRSEKVGICVFRSICKFPQYNSQKLAPADGHK